MGRGRISFLDMRLKCSVLAIKAFWKEQCIVLIVGTDL